MLAFLHIGKTGGSAMLATMRSEGREPIKVFGHSYRLPHIIKKNPNIEIIYGVRDPLSRFVSSFNSRLRQGRPRYNVPWSEAEAIAFKLFDEPNALAEALTDNNEERKYLANFAMLTISHVNKPIAYHLKGPNWLERNKKNIAYAYSIETIEEDYKIIKKILGIPYHVSLPVDEVVAHKTPIHMKKHLSERGQENIRGWYEKDYDIISWTNNFKKLKKKELNYDWES